MLEKDFLRSTPEYLMTRMIGMRKAQNEVLEFQHRQTWDTARMISFFAGNGGNFKGLKKQKDIIRFPWDEEDAEIPSFEDVKKLFPSKYFA